LRLYICVSFNYNKVAAPVNGETHIMIKAVFFDLYFTLVCYDPPQEEIEAGLLHKFGIEISAENLRQPLVKANELIYLALINRPLNQRSNEETMALYAQYHRNILKGASIKADEKIIMGLLDGMLHAKYKLALYDDVIPVLDALKKRGLIVGLISNVERSMSAALGELGLTPKLDVVVTSLDAGANKPKPGIFQFALRKAGVQPAEAIYVGDQYQVDVAGARGAGLKAILLDRADDHEDITDCPRIRGLAEVMNYL
jgi:putative hydrolase of the HAD superfamily